MIATKKIGFSLAIFFIMMTSLVVFGQERSSNGFRVEVRKWYLNPDGQWVVILEARGARSRVHYSSSSGLVVDLPFWLLNSGNSAKIITDTPSSLLVTAHNREDRRLLRIPSPQAIYPSPLQATARAIGPSLVTIGLSWLGNRQISQYHIWRQEGDENEKLIGYLTASVPSYQDDGVKHSRVYHYRIVAVANNVPVKSVMLTVKTPTEMPKKNLSALRGKGLIVYIDPSNPASSFYFKKLTPSIIVNDASQLGLRYIQLRTVYGSYSHFNNKPLMNWLADLLELAGNQHIAILAWSIPRRDSSNAIAEDLLIANFASPSGYRFAGSSLDLETGASYMGGLKTAKKDMGEYAKVLRKAVGPNYLVSAIVFTPYKTGYTNENYPYKELAESTNVLQPMVFWHHYYASSHHYYSPAEVTAEIANSIIMLRMLAGKDIPVNVIGQSINLGTTGEPSSREVYTALQAAKDALGLGVSFFAWHKGFITNGVLSPIAQGIQQFNW